MASSLSEIKEVSTLRGLLQLGKSFATAKAIDELSNQLSAAAKPLTGAANATIAVLEPGGNTVQVYRGPNQLDGYDEVRTLSVDGANPILTPIRTHKPEIITSGREFAELYPQVIEQLGELGALAMISFPLVWEDMTVGAMMFRFEREEDLRPESVPVIAEIAEIVVQDVTRIAEREALANRRAELERSNADLESYAAVVAHDLRGPLRRISSYVQLLVREVGTPSDKAASFAGTIKDQAAYLDRLLNDVLHYSTAVTAELPNEAVSIAGAVTRVQEAMAEELESVGGKIIIDGFLPDVIGNPVLIRQLIANMVSNAVRYAKDGVAPEVTVSAKAGSLRGRVSYWRISVADNGIGLDPQFKDTVFDMFSRLDPTDGKDGTGVGLAFAKRVVERHRGEIGVESEPGVGSVFWFTLPGVTQTWEFDS